MLRPQQLLATLLLLGVASGAFVPGQRAVLRPRSPPQHDPPRYQLLNPDSAGYLALNASNDGSAEMYYIFFEADEPEGDLATTPIILWLQGGPGCSSLFGMLYINGPYMVQPDLSLLKNPGAWNRRHGLLFIDQPVGVGFSRVGNHRVPDRELPLAEDLYRTLNNFYRLHPQFQQRPLFIAGESYAGKYVPSITHYIIQAQAITQGWEDQLDKRREVAPDVEAPLFILGGGAIGNGFTDAVSQTMVQAEVAWGMGLIDTRQRLEAEAIQQQVADLVMNKNYRRARRRSDELLQYITNASASATLEDIRRNKAYDAEELTALFLNQAAVKDNMKAAHDIEWQSCSSLVDDIMGHDVMKSTANLVPDILKFSHLLIYLGQFDAECGVASNEAWLSKLRWPGHLAFNSAERTIWRDEDGNPLGYRKHHRTLTQVVIRNVGHMAPHDNPLVCQQLIEEWVQGTGGQHAA